MDAPAQLATITAELAALPPLIVGDEYLTRHKAFLAAGDSAGLAALTRANAAIRQRRKALEQCRHELQSESAAHPRPTPVLAATHLQPHTSVEPTTAPEDEDGERLLLAAVEKANRRNRTNKLIY